MNRRSLMSNGLVTAAIILCLFLVSIVPTGYNPVLAMTQTTTITVDTTADNPALSACTGSPNDCSLRGAVNYVNADPSSPYVIEIPDGTYLLIYNSGAASEDLNASGDLDIVNTDVTLQGTSQAGTILDGNDTDRVIDIQSSDQTITINDLSIFHGHLLTGEGGGAGIRILYDNDLTLNRVTLQDNVVEGTSGNDHGGGIHSATAHVMVYDSIINNNSAYKGGGISADNSPVELYDSTLTTNTANDVGGGMAAIEGTVAFISGSLFDGNQADRGGGFFNSNMVTMVDSIFQNNTAVTSGGGMILYGTASITNVSLFHNNSVASGGGIHSDGQTNLLNVTINENSSQTARGGGIYVLGGTTLGLNHTTFAGNTAFQEGDAIYAGAVSTVTTVNTIFTAPSKGDICFISPTASWTSNGYNLSPDATCSLSGPGDLPSQDPRLGSYGFHGGLTPTVSLRSSSPAIDGGNPADPAGRLDQRGIPIVDGNGDMILRSDIGAFEFLPVAAWLPLLLR